MVATLALDIGERRIGVASCDALGFLASPLTTVIRTSDAGAIAEIARLAAEKEVDEIVVGLPLGANGEETDQSRRISAFARKLRAIPRIRVVFWDERFTTETAAERLRSLRPARQGAPSARRREQDRRRLDAAAAAVILQDYLDRRGPAYGPSEQTSGAAALKQRGVQPRAE